MDGQSFFSDSQLAAILLIAGGLIFLPGGLLYGGRAMWKWPSGQSRAYLLWERSLVITAVVVTALSLVVLERLLDEAGDPTLARLGTVAYLIAATVIVVAETAYLHDGEWNYSRVVFYVITASLAQAVIGVALLQIGLVPAWAGWATMGWNLGSLAVLLIASRDNIYFPFVHHVAPLIVGIALLASR